MRRLGNASEVNGSDSESSGRMETVGLYDVTNISTISPIISEGGKEIIDQNAWKLKTASNERYLVVASCSDLTVFTLGTSADYFFTTSLGSVITDFTILGNSCFLVVIVDNSKICVLSLQEQQIYYNEDSDSLLDFVESSTINNVCRISLGSRNGNLYHAFLNGDVTQSKENNRIESWQSEQIIEFFTNSFSKITSRPIKFEENLPVTGVLMGGIQSWASISNKSGIYWSGFNEPNMVLIEKDTKWIQIRDTGRFGMLLDENGIVHTFDPLTYQFIHSFDIKLEKNDKILDFIIVDKSFCEIPSLFAVVAEKNGVAKMMIFDRKKKENCFSIECASKATLFSYAGSDRIMMMVEEVVESQTDISTSKIVIRQISQSRPEMRFEALLKHNKFDEAEKFAKKYNLDVQRVYKSRVYHLTERCDSDDDAFTDLMRTMELITDHNMVAETYFQLVEMSRRYDRIHTYLCNAKKRKITDMETMKYIESSSFILSTYRAIAGPKTDERRELSEKSWEYFVNALHGNERWVELYYELLEASAITEARLVWARHRKSLKEFVLVANQEECAQRIDQLFAKLTEAFTTDINSWKSVIEHLTVDLFPVYLETAEIITPKTEELVNYLIRQLEYRDSMNWPDNAIEASTCFDSMTNLLTLNAVTPCDQSYLALWGRYLCVPQENGTTTPISRMKKVWYTLNEMKRLKEVYECSISYSNYINLTSEEICHRILKNALTDPNTVQMKMEKFVKPYMAERNLNQDQTIFNYIQIVSGGESNTNHNGVGWEKQCVQLCSSLSDESRKCRSIISIASSAKLPWPKILEEAVERILKSRTLARSEIEEMQLVCRRTELTRLLSTYGYERDFINVLTATDSTSDIIPVIRCILAKRENSTRFVDCIKALELFTMVQKSDWRKAVSIEFARSLVIISMMKSKEATESIINYINGLDDREKGKTLNLVISFIKSVADTPTSDENIEARDEMLSIGGGLLAYFAKRGEDGEKEMSELHKKLNLMRQLQKEDSCSMILSDFEQKVWQDGQLVKLCKSNESFYQKLIKCETLGISLDRLITMMLGRAMKADDVEEMIDTFVGCVENVRPWIPATPDLIDVLCDFLGWIIYHLPELSKGKEDSERADDIAIIIKRLAPAVQTIIATFPFEILDGDLDFLLQIEGYLYLCEKVISQLLKGQDGQHNNGMEVEIPTTAAMSTSSSRIYGFAKRHGTYTFSNDPALCGGAEGVLSIVKVAPSVARSRDAEIKEDDAHEFRSSWEQFTMFLAMHSQDLLDISTRVYASTLKCFSGEWRSSIMEIEQTVFIVVERMLEQDKFDPWHAVTILQGLPTKKSVEVLERVRGSTGAKRNTQSQLNFLQLAFFMSLLCRKFEMLPTIKTSYEQKYMVKQLAKEGIRASFSQQGSIDRIVQQAAELRVPLAPTKLFEFIKKMVGKFGKVKRVSASEYMIKYATLLIRKASAAGNAVDSQARCETIEYYLDVAGDALSVVEQEDSHLVCSYLISLVYVVCPYNYEVHQFINRFIEKHATEMDEIEFSSNLNNILGFLWRYERMSHITREESIWYTKREHTMLAEEKEHEKMGSSEPFGFGMRRSFEGAIDEMGSSLSEASSFPVDEMIYQKDDVIITDIPPLSSKRIPLHILLMRRKEDIDDIVMAIIKAELSIYNVSIWQAALRSVTWLTTRFSRTQLLSSAIFAHANKYAVVERSLPDSDRRAIFQLLNSNTNRSVVISTIALLFRKIVLSDVKIELLQMGIDMAEGWMKAENIEPPMSSDEKDAIEEQCYRLKDGIAKFSTELALKKNGLYTAKTADNIEKTEELCTLIYDEMIDWANSADVELKCKIVEQIALANDLNLTELHEKLVFSWIEDISITAHYEPVAFDDSFGDNSYMDRQPDETQSKDDMLMLPLFDRNVDKMTVLCRKIDTEKLMMKLATIIWKRGEKIASGYNGVARASCLLLRAFSENELQNWNEKASHFAICGNLESKMYARLMEMTNVKTDEKADKLTLIKTLIQCPSRTPTMTSLIACLIVDHQYLDVKAIEQIMARLQISKQWNVLKSMLDYVTENGLDSRIRSFALLWFKVYENALNDINGGLIPTKDWSHTQCVLLRKWSLWAMGSNVEGGNQFGITRVLKDLGCPISAAIISILSNFTIEKMDDIDVGGKGLERDLPFDWVKMKKSKTVVKMEY